MAGRGTGKGTGTGTGARKKGTGTGAGTGTKKRKRNYTMTETALTAKLKNLDKVNHNLPAETPEEFSYNSRQIEHVMMINEIASQADRNDVNSLRSCFVNYLKLCQQDGFKIGQMAACAAIGVNYQTLEAWARNDNRPEYQQFARMVRQTCSLARETLIADQKINPVIGIFWQRNFDGLRNDTEQVQAIQQETEEAGNTKADYVKKYGSLIDND